jgi:hypothetical protein
MRIPRPRRPTAAFKRKRSPPPQATKLLRYSMVSGIVFMILLAIVFLPQLFRDQSPVATPVTMDFTSLTRLEVTSVGALVPLSKLQATFRWDGATLATLGPPLAGGNATFSFTDANGDGLLGPHDYFQVNAASAGCYRVSIFQIEPGSTFLVGQKDIGCPPT